MMDITRLPEHIFIDIAKRLSGNDLLSCSSVNTVWRSAVNCNDIWRYICKTSIICKTGNELCQTPNLVTRSTEPYSAPDFEPLCKWRKNFMRWKKLKENWLNGKFKLYPISKLVSTFATLECDDDFVLIVENDFRAVSVWNIKRAPYHQGVIKFSLDHVRSEFVKLCKDNLIIVQCNLLQVFRKSKNGFVLYYRSIFDKDDSYSKQLPCFYHLSDWYRSNIGLYPCDLVLRCEQNGDKFIGAILDSDCRNTVLHIWDVNKKVKDIELLIPHSSDNVSDVNLSATERYLFLMITNFTSSSSYSSLHVYDLKEFKFMDFKREFTYIVPAFITCKDTVITIDDKLKCVNIWGVRSKCNKVLECDFNINVNSLQIVRSHLLIGGSCVNFGSKVRVYHLNSLNLVFTADVPYRHTVDFISLIQNRFLIVGAFYRSHFCSVVDMSKGCTLYNIEADDCVYVNSIHSKSLIRVDNELSIISFW